MKVLHVIPSVSPTQGGTTFALEAMVRALVAGGVEVDVATTNDDGGSAVSAVPLGRPTVRDGVRYFYFPRQTRFYKVSLPLARWLDEHVSEYDLVHVHAVFSHTSVAGARAAGRRNVPYVIQPHGILNRWGMANRRPLFKRLSFQFVEQRILQNAAAICFTARQEQREVMQSLARIATVASAVVPLGIDPRLFDPLPPPAVFLDQFPEIHGHPTILFLSRLDEKKGLDLLLEAFAIVRRERPDTRLVIAGDGDPEFVKGLRERTAALRVVADVIWTGFLSGDTKLAALAAATIFVLPSYSENFGMVVAEALAAGVPSVLSDQVALTEDAVEAGAAVQVPCQAAALAAALLRLLDEPLTRARLQERSRGYARANFSMAAAAAKLINFYHSILGTTENSPP